MRGDIDNVMRNSKIRSTRHLYVAVKNIIYSDVDYESSNEYSNEYSNKYSNKHSNKYSNKHSHKYSNKYSNKHSNKYSQYCNSPYSFSL